MVNINGGYNIDEQLKLPIISNNIMKKYNYPLMEKSDPSTFIYNVVKNILDEHHKLNKTLHLKKKKFDWENFKNFSPYQIFTILSLNKVFLFLIIFFVIVISELSLRFSSSGQIGLYFFLILPLLTFITIYLSLKAKVKL